MSLNKGTLLGPEKTKRDRKNISDFINNIQTNKEAFELFYEMAERQRFTQRSPQRKG
jgi:hypothetical protein